MNGSKSFVPYSTVSPSFEAVYTGEKSPVHIREEGWPVSRFTDSQGNIIVRWNVWTWTPMQFLLLDLGYLNLICDPKNEIRRVYAYLGQEKTPVEGVAGCLSLVQPFWRRQPARIGDSTEYAGARGLFRSDHTQVDRGQAVG